MVFFLIFINILLICFFYCLFRSAHHSALLDYEIPTKALMALLPLFSEHSNSPAMIQHAMMLIKQQTEHLNPG